MIISLYVKHTNILPLPPPPPTQNVSWERNCPQLTWLWFCRLHCVPGRRWSVPRTGWGWDAWRPPCLQACTPCSGCRCIRPLVGAPAPAQTALHALWEEENAWRCLISIFSSIKATIEITIIITTIEITIIIINSCISLSVVVYGIQCSTAVGFQRTLNTQ